MRVNLHSSSLIVHVSGYKLLFDARFSCLLCVSDLLCACECVCFVNCKALSNTQYSIHQLIQITTQDWFKLAYSL